MGGTPKIDHTDMLYIIDDDLEQRGIPHRRPRLIELSDYFPLIVTPAISSMKFAMAEWSALPLPSFISDTIIC